MNRRDFLITASAFALAAPLKAGEYPVMRSEEEWRAMLSPMEFWAMREGHTERAGSSELLHEAHEGSYHCKGCDQLLYQSDKKYDSGTGWPSFSEAVSGRVNRALKTLMQSKRETLSCSRCGSHLGILYHDPNSPSGERHSINGISLLFVQNS